jgi:ABC-type sugar transport system ATPase subunit
MPAVAEATRPIVECVDVTVSFDGTRALDRVSVTFRPGEIVGIVGANGAGKSTLGRVIVGELPHGAFSGELRVDTQPVQFRNAREAHAAGIVLIHQERAAVPELTIGENVMLTIEPRGRFGTIDWDELHRRAREHLQMVGVDVDTRQRLAEAGGHAHHLVEVARAFGTGSRLFVFDESTAALSVEEVGLLLRRMRELRDRDAAVLFVSHRLSEILDVSDRVVVLRNGRIVLDAQRWEVGHEELVRAMLGADYHEFEALEGAVTRQDVALELRRWVVPPTKMRKLKVGPVDLTLHEGEVLGLFGPLGAGKTELLASIFGLYGREPEGELRFRGEARTFRHPGEAIASGIALIPSDRRNEGIAPGQSVRDNILLSRPPDVSRYGVIRYRTADQICDSYVGSLGITTGGLEDPIDTLSGGNQQKVLLARAMTLRPRLMLLDEPTRGIDVGAKVDVYSLIRQLAEAGTSCLLTSMDADEVLRVCDRAIVLRDGHQVAAVLADQTSEHELVRLSTGEGAERR